MAIFLSELLPEELSDESAYHLTNFIIDLGLALETHYHKKLNRYFDEMESLQYPENTEDESSDKNSF